MSGTPVDPPPEYIKELIDISHEMSNWRLRKDREGLYILDEIGNFARELPKAHVFLRFESSSTSSKLDVYCHTTNFDLRTAGIILIALIGISLGILWLLTGEAMAIAIIGFFLFLVIQYLRMTGQSKKNIDTIIKRISVYPGLVFHENESYERVFGLGQNKGQRKQSFSAKPSITNLESPNMCTNCGASILSSTQMFCDTCGILLK